MQTFFEHVSSIIAILGVLPPGGAGGFGGAQEYLVVFIIPKARTLAAPLFKQTHHRCAEWGDEHQARSG